MDALGVAGDLGADDAGRIGLLFRTTHAADAAAFEHLDIEGTGRGAIMRTGRMADFDLGVLVHVPVRNTKIPVSRGHLSGNAHAICSNRARRRFLPQPRNAAQSHRIPPDIPGRISFVRRRQSAFPAATVPANKNDIREVGMTARSFMLALAAGLLAAFAAPPSLAQDYPTHAVRIVVPFGAGGPADVAARLIGNVFQESFGQPFVIENRTGAGGVIGTVEAAKSPADGYTLLMMSNTQTANESLLTPDKRKYELMRDLAPIAPVNYSDLVIVVNPQVPVKTLAEFIALAKSQPGKLNYASSGQGTPYHMAGELFKAMAGIDVVHVPYRNSGEARSGVIGGQVQMMIDAVPAMAPNIAENQVRPLATTGKQRSAVLPNVPTAIEAGVPGYEATIWLGLMAPAGTPKPVIDKLNAAVNAMVKRPDIIKLWTEQGAIPMSMTPQEFERFLRGDIEKWADVVKKFDKS
ncbi:tripartite-type tricarboxylate transporter receptor subunit TctC [Bradyrhizobium sp. USDA 376]